MSKVIETTAPISIDLLKEYFTDNSISFLVDYDNSTIKGEQLLTFISNIDIPIDLKFSDDSVFDIVEEYLKFTSIVSVPSLERLVLQILMHMKGIENNDKLQVFADRYSELLNHWLDRIESMAVYNIYTIQQLRTDITEQFEEDDTADLTGINFIKMLNYVDWYLLTNDVRHQPKIYTKYFNDYMFKGDNLFKYWATENNMLYVATMAILDNESPLEQIADTLEEII